MAELSIGVVRIRALKHNINVEELDKVEIARLEVNLTGQFTIKINLETNSVSISAGIVLKCRRGNNYIDLQNLSIETIFAVPDLNDQVDDNGQLRLPLFRLLVNTSYDHLRAIQAINSAATPLESYIIPLLAVKDDEYLKYLGAMSIDPV